MMLLRDTMRSLYVAAPGGACDGRFCVQNIDKRKHQGQSEHFMNRTDSKSEDVFQELWVQIAGTHAGPVANPLPYLFRAANNLMLDRYRSIQAAKLREKAWGDQDDSGSHPSVERLLISREELEKVDATINSLGERAAAAFRMFRIDGMSQRDIAALLGVSLSTVEADLRKVYAALAALKGQIDE